MELWGAGATFSLTKYSDTNGNEIMLIKEWRDLFNQVSNLIRDYSFHVCILDTEID